MIYWTPEEIEDLRKIYKSTTADQLAQHFGKSKKAIQLKCFRLGLKKGYGHSKIRLNDRDCLWLRLNFPHIRNEICATYLGISLRTVNRIAPEMGLKKTEQFMKECHAFTSRKAHESHIRNGTYPAKGFYSPNLRKGKMYQFKSKTTTP